MNAHRGVAPFYAGWHLTNEALVSALRPLSKEQLQLTSGSPDWPIWASAAHLAGARVFWLCHVLKEPGAGTTPFTDPSGMGWEDDPVHPRHADELARALESSWKIVERCLDTWTAEMLGAEFPRTRGTETRLHTRQSVLIRLLTHDAYHCGEISLTLGAHGLGELDLWSGLSRPV